MFSGKVLAIQSMIKGELGKKLVHEITEFEPVPIGVVNDPRCQIKGACNRHDKRAFELIETPILFDARNEQHQVILGMRAAFAESAFLANAERWLAVRTRGRPRTINREFRKIQIALKQSTARLQNWIDIANRKATEEVRTTQWTELLPIPLAACGTSNRDSSSSAPTISLMPRLDGRTDVLISTLAKEAGEQYDKDAVEVERLIDIVKCLKNDPARGIESLIRITDQVFLNPEKFEDDSTLTDSEREALKKGIAVYRTEEFQRITGTANRVFTPRR